MHLEMSTICYARTMRIVYLLALNRYEVLENIRVVQLRLHKASLTAKLDRLSDSKPVLRVKGESREEPRELAGSP